jgi:transposase
MSLAVSIVPDPAHVHLLHLSAETAVIIATVRTSAASACCPQCGHSSTRVHSHYTRRLADLPWQGLAVKVVVYTRKFFCDNAACTRQIFTERLPELVAPYARRTRRLDEWFTAVGFAAGGAAGARLLSVLGVSATPAMLLARMRTYPLSLGTTPRALGIDDFAFRRGRRYGTIVVDLERHRPVDLLPERSAQVVAAWLRAHPGVEIISRDRGGDYAVGARQGAPDAVQIADRFHLIKNLGEVVERVVRRHAHMVEQQTATTPLAHSVATAPPRSETQETHQQVNSIIRRRYEAIHVLAAKGMSGQQIARELGLHRHTVERNLCLPSCPERARHPRRPTMLDPYESYLSQRWAEGCHTARRLWREIVAQGFPGSYQPVSRFAAYLRQQEHHASDALAAEASAPQPTGRRGLTVREAVSVLLRRRDTLTSAERLTQTMICQAHPDIARTDGLLVAFRQVFRERDPAALATWLDEAEHCGVPELRTFAIKLRQDLPAVQAAVVSPFSQGPVEGHIHRLKLLKRSMYGRGNFDLLKQRVLYAANPSA